MKINTTTKILIVAIVATVANNAKAQTDSTLENVKEGFCAQLKNGTAPGLQFAPNTTMLQRREDKTAEPKNSIRNIIKGNAQNMQFAAKTTMLQSQEEKNSAPKNSIHEIMKGTAPDVKFATAQPALQVPVQQKTAVQLASDAKPVAPAKPVQTPEPPALQ